MAIENQSTQSGKGVSCYSNFRMQRIETSQRHLYSTLYWMLFAVLQRSNGPNHMILFVNYIMTAQKMPAGESIPLEQWRKSLPPPRKKLTTFLSKKQLIGATSFLFLFFFLQNSSLRAKFRSSPFSRWRIYAINVYKEISQPLVARTLFSS